MKDNKITLPIRDKYNPKSITLGKRKNQKSTIYGFDNIYKFIYYNFIYKIFNKVIIKNW